MTTNYSTSAIQICDSDRTINLHKENNLTVNFNVEGGASRYVRYNLSG